MSDQPDQAVPPIFLERRSYRRRRMWDAVRMLPFLGAVLWMVPLLWPLPDGAEGEGVATSSALLYLFAVWIFLTFVARLLWRSTSQAATSPD